MSSRSHWEWEENLSFLFTQIAYVSQNIFIKSIKIVTILLLKQMLPKSMFKMPFVLKSRQIFEGIRTVSANTWNRNNMPLALTNLKAE